MDLLRSTEFPWTSDTIYLNNASIGPLPERTRLVLEEFNRGRAAPHKLPDRELFAMLADTRVKIAQLIGAAAEEIALTVNTGFGIGMAARALPLQPGDIVLVSDKEFPANVYPWLRLKDRGVAMELVPTTVEGWPDEARLLERLRDPRVRVLAVSLVQFSNGYLVDLDRLSAATRETGAFLVVDAIQGIGQVPVDLSRTRVDVLACGGQKVAALALGVGLRLRPPRPDRNARPGDHRLALLRRHRRSHPAHPVRRQAEVRCPSLRVDDAALPGFRRAQRFAGAAAVTRHRADPGSHPHPAPAGDRLGRPDRGANRLASGRAAAPASCVSPPRVCREVHRRLKAARIVCSLREGAIRLSPHCYNTVAEMERVAHALAAD